MSTSFFVAPYEPDSWESAPSDLRIDPEQYRRQMQQEWPEAAIQSPPPFPTCFGGGWTARVSWERKEDYRMIGKL
jgi:hypothetical protein